MRRPILRSAQDDSYLLDNEYTIFGRIDDGRAVAERVLEGDLIGRVQVVEER